MRQTAYRRVRFSCPTPPKFIELKGWEVPTPTPCKIATACSMGTQLY